MPASRAILKPMCMRSSAHVAITRIFAVVQILYWKVTNITTCAGADSLGGDKLGDFNLSIKQHAEAVDFMKKFNVPMLVTGGQRFVMACSAKACRNGDAANSSLGTVADVNTMPEYGVRPAVCCVTSVVFQQHW